MSSRVFENSVTLYVLGLIFLFGSFVHLTTSFREGIITDTQTVIVYSYEGREITSIPTDMEN